MMPTLTVVRFRSYVAPVMNMGSSPAPVRLFIRLVFCARLMWVAGYFPGALPSCRR